MSSHVMFVQAAPLVEVLFAKQTSTDILLQTTQIAHEVDAHIKPSRSETRTVVYLMEAGEEVRVGEGSTSPQTDNCGPYCEEVD